MNASDINITRVCYKNNDLTIEYEKTIIDGHTVSTGNIVVEKPSYFIPHPDFEAAFAQAGDIFARHMELGDIRNRLLPIEVAVHKTDNGTAYSINAELICRKAHGRAKIRTPKLSPGYEYFWKAIDPTGQPMNDPDERLDKLVPSEIEALERILKEACLYITEGKHGESPQKDLLDELEESEASDPEDIERVF